METADDQLTDLAGSVFELDDLIAYQEGAIVSRTLLDREAVTMTAFAVAAGQSISEHSAPHDALLQVVDGTARVSVGDESHDVEAGECLVFPAEKPHALEAPSRFKMFLTMTRE